MDKHKRYPEIKVKQIKKGKWNFVIWKIKRYNKHKKEWETYETTTNNIHNREAVIFRWGIL